MGRRAKPAKAKAEVHDLERRLAEALEQRAALLETFADQAVIAIERRGE